MKTVLYVCVHNAGRSQMAEALTNALAKERGLPITALSAGTVAGTSVNPVAVAERPVACQGARVYMDRGFCLTLHSSKP